MDQLKHTIHPRIEQRIDTHLELVRRMREQHAGKPARHAPFLTLSRQYGCEAMELAESLAPKLAQIEKLSPDGWQVYNRQIVESITGELHLSDRIVDALDVRARSGIEEFMQALIGESPPDLKVLHGLTRTARSLALLGRCILVGRGGVVLTKDLPGGIHIRLVAPEEWRLNKLLSKFGWSSAEAHARLHEEETSRTNFFKKYLGKDLSDPVHYDLTINVARTPKIEQEALILALFTMRLAGA
jgi:cytidylate kinase